MSNGQNKTTTFGQRMGRAFVFFLRTLLVLVIIFGIAALVYFGTPYLYDKFILPVESNTARLSEIENKHASDSSFLADQVSTLKTRLAELENRQTVNAQAIAELLGQVQALESAVDAHSETLNLLDTMQTSLDMLMVTTANHESLLVGENSALSNLQSQINVSRTIELLSRARLYLSQSNFGLAKQDVQKARDLLFLLQKDLPDDKLINLQGAIARLDLALGNLPAFPVVAVDDVDIAWQLLVIGLPDFSAEAAPLESDTGTPIPAIEVTPSASP